jgi:tetratricopeptide (TPR) repeat protein
MKSLSRFLAASVCASLFILIGCQSGGPRKETQEGAAVPAAAGNPTRVAMTLPRPAVPETAPLVLNRPFPEPRIVEVQTSDSIPEASLDQETPVIESGFHLPEPEVVEVIPFETPYFRKIDRGFPIRTAAAKTADPPEAKPERTATSVAVRPTPTVEEVEETHRELVARRGDQIGIDLEGRGWIYLGLDPGSGEGIGYLSSQYSQAKSSFSFKALEYGAYELSFQFQDNQNAVLRSQIVHIEVLPDADFRAALELRQQGFDPQQTTVTEPEPGPRIDKAEALFSLGEYELALIEFTRNMRSGDPYMNDRLAACYEATGEHLAAVKYYRDNLSLSGEYRDRAALGMIRAGVALKDPQLLTEVLPSLFTLESGEIGSALLEVARFQVESRRYATAIEALRQYMNRYPDGRQLDEVYYRLARIYEVDSPYRDLELSRHYYELLYENFPESPYAERAGERLNYLDRHFFLVQ